MWVWAFGRYSQRFRQTHRADRAVDAEVERQRDVGDWISPEQELMAQWLCNRSRAGVQKLCMRYP